MAGELEIVEDVPGERLVLVQREGASRLHAFAHSMRESWVSFRDGFAGLLKEIMQQPKSVVDLTRSLGLSLLVVALVALVLLALSAAAIGVVLVFVLYVIGVWLVAWWLVRAAAYHVARVRLALPSRPALVRRLEVRRDEGRIAWRSGVGSRSLAFDAVSSVHAIIETRPGTACDITLGLGLRDGERTSLHLAVAGVDREGEGADVCFRLATVLGWQGYAASRHRLLGLELELVPAAPEARSAHPFRAYAAEPRYRVIPVPASEDDLGDVAPAKFQEPIERPPRFEPSSVETGGSRVRPWRPGALVRLDVDPRHRTGRALLGHVVGTVVGCAVTLSVMLILNLAEGTAPLTMRGADGRHTLAGVLGILTGASAVLGWVAAIPLWWRRFGRSEVIFDWTAKTVTFRDDEGSKDAPLGAVQQLVLHETGTEARRYTLQALFADRPPVVIWESEAKRDVLDAHAPPLALTIELARALGIPWRCVARVR
jgi:hypothetical protein